MSLQLSWGWGCQLEPEICCILSLSSQQILLWDCSCMHALKSQLYISASSSFAVSRVLLSLWKTLAWEDCNFLIILWLLETAIHFICHILSYLCLLDAGQLLFLFKASFFVVCKWKYGHYEEEALLKPRVVALVVSSWYTGKLNYNGCWWLNPCSCTG